MITISDLGYIDFLLLAGCSWTVYKLISIVRSRVKTTKLNGPPSSSLIFGVTKDVYKGDAGALHEEWGRKYGPVYQIPVAFGGRQTILMDPKAISHFYMRESFTYVHSHFAKQGIAGFIGKGLIYAEGENHRRQRKALSPAFSNAAIRSYTSVFYDSAYKVKNAWDAVISSSKSNDAIIEVQKWMNSVSLDSIGIAGFSHDFGALQGEHSPMEELFDTFGSTPPGFFAMLNMLLGAVFPFLRAIPDARNILSKRLHDTMEETSKSLLERSRREKDLDGSAHNASRSIIGSLIKAELTDSELRLTPEEALAQMKVLMVAGYETTSVSLTWALIELSLVPEKQEKLRAELAEFTNKDPTYEQLTNGLPYLNAVAREVIRLHPAVQRTERIAACDDVIPLSQPIKDASGKEVDRITLSRGSSVYVPIRAINRSEEFWGPDAKDFKPERWLDEEAGVAPKAKELQGYHHILSFSDGARICLGRHFAFAEFKSVLSVLIRNYVFELRDGPETKLDVVTSIVPRPKVAGEKGYNVPMRVRRVEY